MAQSNATILIPDISGFTEFMTTTELSHSTKAIHMLIDAIIKSVEDEYEVAEIEGDAVLLIKKGQPPSKKEIQDICLKIFNAFHFQRKWMEQHTICPCGACVALINLTLKFVVTHGELAQMKVGRFVTHSGPEMIIAHRLLKNGIGNNEYLLVTEKLMKQAADSADLVEMEWRTASEEYASIGKVDYRFTLLNEARKKVPQPPKPQTNYRNDSTYYIEMPIAANFRDAYMLLMNIPERHTWMPGLQKVEQEMPEVFIGSIHQCTFENFKAVISPMRMIVSDDGIVYAESCRIDEMNLSLVHEFVFKKTDENNCLLIARFINADASPVPKDLSDMLSGKMQQIAERIKEYCEKKVEV